MMTNRVLLQTLPRAASLFAWQAEAATVDYYFSNSSAGNPAGDDSTGDGSQSNPWSSLARAQQAVDTLDAGDTANLFFDRQDMSSPTSAARP